MSLVNRVVLIWGEGNDEKVEQDAIEREYNYWKEPHGLDGSPIK